MKNPLFIIISGLLICAQTSYSQGIQAGIKGTIASTWLINSHVSDASANVQQYVPSFGENYGVSGAIFFNKKLGFEMDFFYATHRQQYNNEDETYESETKLNQVSIPMLLKLRSETGAYFELGVVYNALTKAQYSLKFDSISLPSKDIKPLMSNSSFDAMFGIGVDIEMVAGLDLTFAMRFTYGMNDLKGVDAFGQDMSDPVWLTLAYDGTYEQTRAASGGFLIGLTYSIGKLAGD